ncbi:hypothetical protein ACSBR2_008919 [Camellia fascicularis]
MVENSVGEPELLCNNRGVDFIEAFAYVKLQDLNLYNPNETIEGKLVPKKMRGVLCVQADQLSHPQSLVDGSGIGRKKTKLEAFSAFLWKMVVAREVERNKICWMGIVVNGMLRMGSKETDKLKLMNSYFGNVLSISLGEKRADELRERPLSWAADMVHECLESAVTKEHFLDLIDWVEVHRLELALTKLYANGGDEDTGPAFVVSPEQQFPVSKVDFGWGKPMLGSHHFPWGMETGYVMPMPSPLGNGDWVVYMHLLKGQMELIETHSARVCSRTEPGLIFLMFELEFLSFKRKDKNRRHGITLERIGLKQVIISFQLAPGEVVWKFYFIPDNDRACSREFAKVLLFIIYSWISSMAINSSMVMILRSLESSTMTTTCSNLKLRDRRIFSITRTSSILSPYRLI